MYQLSNWHGDIVGTVTQAGVFTAQAYPDEYGNVTAVPSSRLGWLGSQQRFVTAPALGIIRMGVRLYDPKLGRFLAQDPIEGGSCNDYDYTCANPIGGLDLTGTCDWWSVVCRFNEAARKYWEWHRWVANYWLSQLALSYGHRYGGKCSSVSGRMTVCINISKNAPRNRNFSIGNVYLTHETSVGKAKLAHETKHADQWALAAVGGPQGQLLFAAKYIGAYLAGMIIGGIRGPRSECYNPYEISAGLKDGGYTTGDRHC